jgi:hypothetical protein
MKDELLFIPFMIFKKCSIPFMLNDSDLYVKFLCWENGVLHFHPMRQPQPDQYVKGGCIVAELATTPASLWDTFPANEAFTTGAESVKSDCLVAEMAAKTASS